MFDDLYQFGLRKYVLEQSEGSDTSADQANSTVRDNDSQRHAADREFDTQLCVLCSSPHFETILSEDAKSKNVLSVARCLRCGLIQQNPMPSTEELEIYYSHHYRKDYKSLYQPDPRYVYRAGVVAKKRLEWMSETISTSNRGRLLDVGSGGGEFVYCAKKMNYESSGIEPNFGYSEFARLNYGVEIQTGMLSGVGNNTYDVITLFHVLEHMANPTRVVRKLYDLLSENGYLVIEVPNILQLDASPSNIFFKAHLTYYSSATISSLFSSHFDRRYIDSRGNLKMIFQKKSCPSIMQFPSCGEVRNEKLMFDRKTWLSYLTIGGGWKKIFKNCFRRLAERRVCNSTPKKILDEILECT